MNVSRNSGTSVPLDYQIMSHTQIRQLKDLLQSEGFRLRLKKHARIDRGTLMFFHHSFSIMG